MYWRSTQITRLPTCVQGVLGPNITVSFFSQEFCGFYHDGPAKLGENNILLNTVFIIPTFCTNVSFLAYIFPA